MHNKTPSTLTMKNQHQHQQHQHHNQRKTIEDMLDAALPKRKTQAYKIETIEDMLEELTHRGVDIPEQEKDEKGKDITTGYKQILYDLMTKSD